MSGKEEFKLNIEDFADILSRTLALAAEVGLTVGVRNAEANAKRPEGLMIYVANLRTDGNGSIFAVVNEPAVNGELEPA